MRPVVWGVDGAGLVLHGHAESGRTVAAPGRLRAVVVETLLDVVGRMSLVKSVLLLLLLLQGGMELVVLVTILKGRGGNCHRIDQLVLLVLVLLMMLLLLLMWTAAAGRTT